MRVAALETTLELWSATLRRAKQRIRPLFAAPSVAASANAFLDGLLGAERRKTSWMRAEAAGDPGPWRQQAILGRSRWDADALRDVVRDDGAETLAAPDAVLVIDETGFLKQGNASCGVGRQYTGSAGKITNCQIGVFAAYVSNKGHASRAMPSWTDSSICRKPGPAIQHGCGPRTCRRAPPLQRSPSWRLAWSSGRSRRVCRSDG
jgi:SRSO17 transposase